MNKKKRELQDRINDALTTGVRVIVVQDSDKQLAIHAALVAAKAHCTDKPKLITSTSRPINKEGKETNGSAMDIIEDHKKHGENVLVAVNILQSFGNSPLAVALISELASEVKEPPFPRLILIESKRTVIPALLKDDIELINVPLPGVEDMQREVSNLLKAVDRELKGGEEALGKVAKSLVGVDRNIGSRLCSQSIVEQGDLDPVWLAQAKADRVMEMSDGMLSIMSTEAPEVGGMENLMKWADIKAKAYCSSKAKAFGLKEPKGAFLTGIPGCGKTLFAKAVAKRLGVPLVRFDLSRMFAGIVGASEQNLSSAIEAIEAMSPNVVLMDECDKAFAGATGPSGDSGTTQRLFGSLLTWLQERTSPNFIVATSNNAKSLPPEVMRKGRFDEVFFIDLPTEKEREQIARIHVLGVKRKVEILKPGEIAAATAGFSGSEIEQVIMMALEMAFAEDREVTLDDVVKAANRTNPLSKTQGHKINELREWARATGVVMAGTGETVKISEPDINTDGGVRRMTLDLSDKLKKK